MAGYGQSSPIVWRNTVYLTSVEGSHKEILHVLALDARSGERLWQRDFAATQPVEDSGYVSKAAPTPAADSERLYIFFESGDLLALSHEGEPLWRRRLPEEYGLFQGRHGIGSSLRLTREAVLALVAHEGPSYLLAADRTSGETRWKAERPPGVAWTTPAVIGHGGREMALVSASGLVDAYDASQGKLLWRLDGFEGNLVPSPTPFPGGAIIGASKKRHTAAVRFPGEASGRPEVAWRAADATSYFNSPLYHRGLVYMVSKAGVAYCLDGRTGEQLWFRRLAGACWASAIAHEDRIYFFGVDGITEVFRAGAEPEKLAENSLPSDGRVYGVAVDDGAFFIRTGRRLFKVSSAS